MATPDRRDGEDARRADDGPRWRVEGARDPKHEGKGKSTSSRFRIPGSRRFWILVAILLLINWWLASQIREPEPKLSVPYSVFRQEVQQGNVSSIVTRGGEIEGTFKKAVRYPPGSTAPADKEFVTERPSITDDGLLPLLVRENVKVEAQAPAGSNIVTTILVSFGPTLLFILLFFFILRRLGTGGGGFSGMGRSKARRYEPTMQRTTFADVAGIEEAEEQLVEIVDFLRSPEKYSRLGGAIPSGVLLSGPPGTGKTLLARALAGEAGVPFFSMSASEFVEMVVGVGASRVRDLFEQAKAEAPAIVFIDELDAVGRARGGSNQFAGHDEREQTLNQILTEMDGFSGTEGVIVIASTNRPEILDTALLRPGRFDRHVVVNPPDQRGRRAILGVHTRDVPLADDVDLDQLASTTPGMVGADLRNVINESALLAARRDHERVTKADVSDALEKVILGAARRLMLSRADKERTAYHESGHALLGMLLPGSDPVRKVSIVPRGGALGITLQTPESDRYGYTADFLVNRITTALGGRAAEELVYGHYTTGAEADLQYVTRLARSMVGRWGMSEAIGPLAVLPPSGAEGFVAAGDLLADETRQLFDAEVRRIVDESYQHAMTLLRQHRPQLDALVAGLLEAETLDEAEAYSIAGIQRPRTADNGTAAAAVAEILDEPALTAEPDET